MNATHLREILGGVKGGLQTLDVGARERARDGHILHDGRAGALGLESEERRGGSRPCGQLVDEPHLYRGGTGGVPGGRRLRVDGEHAAERALEQRHLDGEGDLVPVPRGQVVLSEEEVLGELRDALRAAAVGPRGRGTEEVVEEHGVRGREEDMADAAHLVHGR